MRRGTPTFFDGSLFYDFLRPLAGINDAGNFAFGADTTAPSSVDEIIARWTAADGFALVSRQGTQALGQPPGVNYSGTGNARILNDDTVAFLSFLSGGGEDAIYLNSAIDEGMILVQTGLTVPENQVAGPHVLAALSGTFVIDATGQNYLYTGTLANNRNVIVVNNRVVAEFGAPLPGHYPGVFYSPLQATLDRGCVSRYNGHYAFTNIADLGAGPFDDVVVVDDRVVAATGQPIIPGSPELWDAGRGGFFLTQVNSRGDYLVGGYTNAPLGDEEVLVWNGRVVLFRSGDPIDLNGDGLPNDGWWIAQFRTDSGYLTDNGRFYFSNVIAFPGENAEAFLWMPVPVPGDLNCDATMDFFDIDPFLLALFDQSAYATTYPDCWPITADINRDDLVDFFDIDPFLECLFAQCP